MKFTTILFLFFALAFAACDEDWCSSGKFGNDLRKTWRFDRDERGSNALLLLDETAKMVTSSAIETPRFFKVVCNIADCRGCCSVTVRASTS